MVEIKDLYPFAQQALHQLCKGTVKVNRLHRRSMAALYAAGLVSYCDAHSYPDRMYFFTDEGIEWAEQQGFYVSSEVKGKEHRCDGE